MKKPMNVIEAGRKGGQSTSPAKLRAIMKNLAKARKIKLEKRNLSS